MPAVRIGDEEPATLTFELFCLLRRIERADRLCRAVERGIVCGDADVREDAGRLAVAQRGA